MPSKKPHLRTQAVAEKSGRAKKVKGTTERTAMQRVKVYRNNRAVFEWREREEN